MREIRISACPDVYPPSDDTYMLAEAVNREDLRGKRFLEIGCGAGLVSITSAIRGAEVTAVDINPKAVECTRANAERNGIHISAFVSDLFEKVDGKFDVIAFNPPYLPGTEDDPAYDVAWSGGPEGRDVVDCFLADVDKYLNPCGVVLLVQSSLNHPERTESMLKGIGYSYTIVDQRRFFMETLYVVRAVKPCQ